MTEFQYNIITEQTPQDFTSSKNLVKDQMNEKILSFKSKLSFKIPHYLFDNHGLSPDIELISLKIDESPDASKGDMLI